MAESPLPRDIPATQSASGSSESPSIDTQALRRKKKVVKKTPVAPKSRYTRISSTKSTKRQTPSATTSSSRVKKRKWTRRDHSKFSEIMNVLPKFHDAVEKLSQRNDTHPDPDALTPAANGLYFSRYQDAAVVNMITYWQPPQDDDTIPTTQASREIWIHRLLSAIKNNQGCLKTNESKPSTSFQIRWGTNATFYPPTAIEAVAWKILVSTCCYSTCNIVLTLTAFGNYDP